MADQKLSALTPTTTALITDILYIVGNTTQTSYQITFDNLQKSVKTLSSVTFTALSGTTITATSLASLNLSTTNLTGATATLTTLTATNLNGNNVDVATASIPSLSGTTVTVTTVTATNLRGNTSTVGTITASNLNGATVNAATVTAVTIACTNLTVTNSGFEPAVATGTAVQFWRGDKNWAVPAGSGDVSHSGDSTAGNIVFFSDTTGTLITDNNYNANSFASATHTHAGGSTTTGSIIGSNIAVSVTNSILADTTISIPQSVATNANVVFATVTATSLGSLNVSTTNLTFGTITGTTVTATSLWQMSNTTSHQHSYCSLAW